MDVFRGVVKLMKRDRARAVREIARIDAALAALAGAGSRSHTMSAAARKKISLAQKARWAKARLK